MDRIETLEKTEPLRILRIKGITGTADSHLKTFEKSRGGKSRRNKRKRRRGTVRRNRRRSFRRLF